MSHNNTILSQILRLVPRHDFKRLAFQHDGKRRSDAMSRWTQFVSMAMAQLCSRSSLRDIEATIASQSHLGYHLGSGPVKRTTLSRINRTLDFRFYESLFSKVTGTPTPGGSISRQSESGCPSHPLDCGGPDSRQKIRR